MPVDELRYWAFDIQAWIQDPKVWHIWTLSSGHVALSAHVVMDDPGRWQGVLRALGRMLEERFAIDHGTLQPESRDIPLRRVPLADLRRHGDGYVIDPPAQPSGPVP